MVSKSTLPLLLVSFIDFIGIGIVIPVLGPLFIDPSTGFLPAEYSLATRTMMFGLMIAAYPLAQFFGAPILGALSDRHGRKKLIMLSLAGTLVGYVAYVYGIMTHDVALMFAGRIVDGFTGGNFAIVLAAIADTQKGSEKTRTYGLVGTVYGAGLILGPWFGGKLSEPSFAGTLGYAAPFAFAAALCALNMIALGLFFRETLVRRRMGSITLLRGVANLRSALARPDLRVMFAVVFLLTFGYSFFFQFMPVFLIDRFRFGPSHIGDAFAYMGIWIAVGQGIFARQLARTFKPNRVLMFSILALAVFIALLLSASSELAVFMILPFIAVSRGMAAPNMNTIVSDEGAKDAQGEILGINQSVQALAQAVPPLVAGAVASIDSGIPLMLGSASVFAAWLIFVVFFSRGRYSLSYVA